MSKQVLTQEQIDHTNAVYASGGFVPRRKGQRHAKYWDAESGPDFYNQQGQAHETVANPVIASVKPLGKFQGYDQYGSIIWYRAFAVTLKDGSLYAGYSRDGDNYVLCQETSFLPAR